MFRDSYLAIKDALDKPYPAARGGRLIFGDLIRRASGQAKPAMHALREDISKAVYPPPLRGRARVGGDDVRQVDQRRISLRILASPKTLSPD